MRVIDLLNKIANGEEVPRKFMVDGDTLYIGEDKFIEYANGKRIEWFIYPSWLNEEVEVIEKDKPFNERVEEIYNRHIDYIYDKEDKKVEHYYFSVFQDERLGGRQVVESLESKINEIIDTINEMREDK